jgi:uncharacterized protein YuzE
LDQQDRKVLEGGKMKIKYDNEADILIIIMRDAPPVDAIEEPWGVIVSYGEDNQPVSVEFLNASARKLVQPNEFSVTLQTKNVATI